MTYAIKAPARYAQGAGELANLGRSAKKLGDKFLVICSDNSRGRFGAQVEASLAEQEKEAVFTTFHGEATKDEVFSKMDECRAQGCDVSTENRLRILRLIENLSLGTAAVGYRTESMHGAGSPQAQRIMISRQGNLAHKKELAKAIAHIKE